MLAASNSKIPSYLKASVAMPFYNRAVRVDDSLYFDGAMMDNIPVFPLLRHKLDCVICIYFDDTYYKFENAYFDNKIIKITFPCRKVIKPSLIFSQISIENMIESGYDRTIGILKFIFCNGYQDIESVYNAIECRNQSTSRNLRITGDVLITNLNKITQKLSKRIKRIVAGDFMSVNDLKSILIGINR